MKKLLSLVLLLALLFTLAGCSRGVKDQVFTRGGVSITLPETAVDKSKTDTASEYPFIFVAGNIVITAMEVNKEDFDALTLEDFGKLLITANGVDTSLEKKDGLFTYVYTDDGDWIMSIVLETDTRFWFISATCDEKDYDALKNTMWHYLQTVKVTDK